MKKDKPKSSIKLLRDSIKENLVKELKQATGSFSPSKKLDKKIEKGSKDLAKKIAKAVKPVKVAEALPKVEAIVAEKIKPIKVKKATESAITETTTTAAAPKAAKTAKKVK